MARPAPERMLSVQARVIGAPVIKQVTLMVVPRCSPKRDVRRLSGAAMQAVERSLRVRDFVQDGPWAVAARLQSAAGDEV